MIKSPKSSRAIPAAPRAIPPKPSRPATRATTRAAIAHPKSVILFPPSNSGPSHAPSDRDLLNTGSYLAGLRRRRRQHCTLGASDLAIEARPVTSPTRITREAGRVNISRYRPGIQIWIHSAARRRGGAGTGARSPAVASAPAVPDKAATKCIQRCTPFLYPDTWTVEGQRVMM